ncbi:MAG: sugar phosphate isomerase/epimerase, partial [Alistipes sp.]|nr:sugar phosphate isomerase/epimerase [Alistipes sp.]
LVENTNPEYVFFELDVYWCTMGEKDPVEYLKKYADRIKMLHIKDEFVIGESGKINFEGIFKQFYKNGYSDFVVEIETPRELRAQRGDAAAQQKTNDAMFEAAKKSAEYLQKAKFVK